MSQIPPYLVLAYYEFVPIANPHEEVALHKAFFEGKDVTCRIYISEQGINGQMCAARQDAQKYMEWMHSRTEFKNIHFKLSPWHEQAFPRTTVKYRKHLVAIDEQFDLSNKGDHVSPKQWKEMLEKEEERVLLDVRNDYEWKVGHFEGAELPPCETFREFASYAEQLKQKVNPEKTPVMMYCTGGIRCELYSSILKEKGFDKVYQLHGGIINYGLEEGVDHWKGKLFVFDDRLVVPVSEEPTEVVGTCHFCSTSIDNYFNCANMNCNELFLCCPDCLQKFSGCCCEECKNADRVRPYHHQNPHKPFRRGHHYFGDKKPVCAESE